MRTLLVSMALLPLALACQGEAIDQEPGPGGLETVAQEIKVPNIKVGKGSPTGTYFNSTLWLAYTGTDNRIHTLERTGSTTFIDRTTSFHARFGPSLIVYHGKLHLVWTHGTIGDHVFLSATSSDGQQWMGGDKAHRVPKVKHAAGLVVYQDELMAFVTFNGVPTVMQYIWDEGSNDWRHVFNTGMISSAGPSAAVLGNDLVVAAEDWSDQRVMTQKFVSGQGWQAENFVVPERYERPHVISAGNSLLLLGSQIANIGPNEIRFDRTFDGVNLEDLGYIGDTTKERPHGIRADSSSVELVYRGTNNNLYLINVGLPVN